MRSYQLAEEINGLAVYVVEAGSCPSRLDLIRVRDYQRAAHTAIAPPLCRVALAILSHHLYGRVLYDPVAARSAWWLHRRFAALSLARDCRASVKATVIGADYLDLWLQQNTTDLPLFHVSQLEPTCPKPL